MDYQVIKQPAPGVIKMLEGRAAVRDFAQQYAFDTIGLVQGKLVDMVAAADVAEKASDVRVIEIKGICPQHFTMIALFGDTAAVVEAVDQIKAKFERGEAGS